MYERIEICPLCNSKKIENLLICKDHFLSQESFAINACKICSLRFTNPRPNDHELSKYYKSDNYISHSNRSQSITDYLYKLVRIYTIRKKRKLIEKLIPTGTILDVGCGTGDFLNSCKKNNWKITGIEPDADARLKAISLTNSTIYAGLKDLPEENKYNIITLWHVLEHMPNLRQTIKKIKSNLKKNGYLIIALPNFESLDASLYKEYWAGYDVPRHLFHFNQSAMRFLASKFDLKLKRIAPMKFDSFYVSLLSEKYSTGKIKYIKSFIMGLKSNTYASKNNNYSSLIYILKK